MKKIIITILLISLRFSATVCEEELSSGEDLAVESEILDDGKEEQILEKAENEKVSLGNNVNSFRIEGTVLKEYTGTDRRVIIPDTVTEIAPKAFSGCKEVESVVIPDSVETIGIYAFGHCTELKEVIIGNKVKTLGKGCFENTGLTSVVIPESVETIGIRAFWGCTKLSAVTLNSGLLTIGLSAFHGCGLISSIVIPSSVVEIRNRAFEDCTALKIIYVPESVKMLGYDIFYNTDNITIYGVAGSEAEDYAKQYSILFVNGRIPETNPIDEGWKQDKTGWWY